MVSAKGYQQTTTAKQTVNCLYPLADTIKSPLTNDRTQQQANHKQEAISFERGHKPRCCKVQIVFLVAVGFTVVVVVVFGVPNSLLL